MCREDPIRQVQQKVAEYQPQLTEMFLKLLAEAQADAEFLAFEDTNGRLAIAANKGDSWYLSRNADATGEAVTRVLSNGNATVKVPEIEEHEARLPVHFSSLGGLTHEPRLYSSLLF